MARLDRIRIAGYKSIRDQTIELRDLNVLIGANGAGKSNLLSVFKMLRALREERLGSFVASAGYAAQIFHRGLRATSRLELAMFFGRNKYECSLAPGASSALYFEQENASFYDPDQYEKPMDFRFGSGHSESGLLHYSGKWKVPEFVLRSFAGWRLYHFHDTGDSAPVKNPGSITNNAFLQEDAGNLAAVLYLLARTEPAVYRNIVDNVREVAPYFVSFHLRPNPLNQQTISLEWSHRGIDELFPAAALSDGTLRFMCLVTLFLQPDLPSTIILDEPELGLHPAAIHLLAGLIRSAATRTQVILATQSVTLLNQFTAEDILVAERQGEESVFRRPPLDELASWLDEYSVGELWEKNLLGGRPGA